MKFVIIESEEQTREIIKNTVQKTCPEAVLAGTAQNGKEGYELARAEKPDLVIMDLQLPGMAGLSMLKKLRAEKIDARVIVTTADTDFDHARQAIGLSVDYYILKPIKILQLKNAVRHVVEKMENRRALERTFTVENIFAGCLNGQLRLDQNFHRMTREKFGFDLEDPGALFTVWVGNGYTEQREEVCSLLEKAGAGQGFDVCPVSIDVWHLVAAVIYRTGVSPRTRDNSVENSAFEREYKAFREHIVPMLRGRIRGEIICLWEEAEHMAKLQDALMKLRQIREWNLLFDRGDLIRREDVEALEPVPLKYPAELEGQVRQAVLAGNGEEIKKCFYRLYDAFRREPYDPREIKEVLIRFNMAVLGVYKTQHEVGSELGVQYSMQKIADAISWGQIRSAMESFFDELDFSAFEKEDDRELSALVRKAAELVRKYYDQGITLEEIAAQLFVTEEYLSSQFKKETGRGFSETVRSLRIERIKGLLAGTRLKLNQIAELTGYTDPKYMSKIFKEEVGMLPTEFRKSVH